MTLADDLVGLWARAYTDLPLDDVGELERRARGKDARDAKLDLAEAVVSRYHGAAEATVARQEFIHVFSERRKPEVMPRVGVRSGSSVLEIVLTARPDQTQSAARRLIAGGGVRLNGTQRVTPEEFADARTDDVLQAGRRRWFALDVTEG